MKQFHIHTSMLTLVCLAACAQAKPIISAAGAPRTQAHSVPALARLATNYQGGQDATAESVRRYRVSAPRERFDKRGRLLEWTSVEKQRIIELDKSSHPALVVVAPPTIAYNCHALTFISSASPRSRKTVIQNSAVPKILRQQGWTTAARATYRPGDIVIYKNSRGQITHTGIVKAVQRGKVTRVRSKWGRYGEYLHHPHDVPSIYGKLAEVRTGGRLIGDHAPLSSNASASPIRISAQRALSKEPLGETSLAEDSPAWPDAPAVGLDEITSKNELAIVQGYAGQPAHSAYNGNWHESSFTTSLNPKTDFRQSPNANSAVLLPASLVRLLGDSSSRVVSILAFCSVATLGGLGYLTSQRRRTSLLRG